MASTRYNTINFCYYCGANLKSYSFSTNCANCGATRRLDLTDTLSKDLEILLLDAQFSDVKLVCCDGVKIPAHRNILSARSPVFRAVFNNNMQESTSDVVNTPFDSDTVRKLLTYLYSGDLTKQDFNEMMLEVSEYYQVDSLKRKAEDFLITKITIDNCLQYLVMADQFRSDKILQATLEFFKNSSSKQVIANSEIFEKLHTDIIKLLFLYVGCNMNLSQIKSRTLMKK